MTLWLKPEQARTIIDHARRAAPDEACGLLLGRAGEVTALVPARNVDPDPRTGYIVAPQDLFDSLSRADRDGLEMVAAYHSHPAGPPVPSARDLLEWHYPDAAMLIVGLGGAEPELAAWRVADGRVDRARLIIQSDRPLPARSADPVLTPVQRLAVVAAGLIAVAIVLVAAFSLLPPPVAPT